MKVVTLVIIHDSEKVLLGYKKRGFGAGRWNGFGGKVEEGESLEQAALRELREESGLVVSSAKRVGEIEFTFANGDHLQCHVFSIPRAHIESEPEESEEMKPQWFVHHEIPYSEMWSDDAVWLPHVLDGKTFKAYFEFDSEAGNAFARHEINFVDQL